MRAGMLIVLASVAGYGVTLAATPLLSRLVHPEVFGQFAIMLAIASSMVGAASLRLEVLSLGEPDDERAGELRVLALRSVLLFGITAALVAIVFWVATGSRVGLWVPAIILMGSVPSIALAKLQRERRYKAIAADTFVQGAGLGIFQLGFAWLSPTVASLAAGYALSRSALLRHVDVRSLFRRSRGSLWASYRAKARQAGTSAFINNLAGQLPLLLTGAVFSPSLAGILAMGLRVFVSPLSVVGRAAAHLSMGEITLLMRNRRGGGNAAKALLKGMGSLSLLVAPILIGALTMGPYVVALVLGEGWAESGDVVRALALGASFQFVVSPFSQLLNVGGASSWLLKWDLARLVGVSMIFLSPAVVRIDLLVVIWSYSALQFVLYLVMGFRIFKVAQAAG